MSDEGAKPEPAAGEAAVAPAGWLNRDVVGMGVTSFLADASYETVTSVLPGFLETLGARPVALGIIEGTADALSSFVKLGSGWWGDKVGRRKPLVTLGYALTGVMAAVFAVAVAWPLVLVGKLVAWLGKGIRGPLRNAMLAEAVPDAHRGKAFGFHRASDTLGAIVGPLAGFALLRAVALSEDEIASAVAVASGAAGAALMSLSAPYRTVFWWAVLPGLASGVAFAWLVRERPHTAAVGRKFLASLAELPADFRRFLLGVGVFGAGDFSATLLILAATQLLTPVHGLMKAAEFAALLYAWRNGVQAAVSFPVGALSDRYGRRGLLVLGYALGGLVMLGFAAAFVAQTTSLVWLGVLFAGAGTFMAMEEALEGAMTADLVADRTLRGTAYGVLGTVNGVGDLISSVLVGVLWTAFGPVPGFVFAAVLMLAGTVLLHRVR